MSAPLVTQLARSFNAYQNCLKSNNTEWRHKHLNTLEQLVREYMPSGAGFDSGTTLDIGASREDKLVFTTSFHHMDDHGSYTRWTEHTVTVRPSLAFDFVVKVSGRDYRDTKTYIAECFQNALSELCGARGAQ